MIKKIAWNTFKNTGDINSFLEFKQIENIENTIENNSEEMTKKIENNINNKDKETEL